MKSAQLFNMQCHSSAVGSYRRGGDDRSADAAVVSFAEQSRRRMTVPGFLATAHVSLLELVSRGLVFKETRGALALGARRRMNSELNFPPNFEGLVLGCIDADFCK